MLEKFKKWWNEKPIVLCHICGTPVGEISIHRLLEICKGCRSLCNIDDITPLFKEDAEKLVIVFKKKKLSKKEYILARDRLLKDYDTYWDTVADSFRGKKK